MICVSGCLSTPQCNDDPFRPPILYQAKSSDSLSFYNVHSISNLGNIFIGKSTFCDSLEIPISSGLKNNPHKDLIYETYRLQMDSLGRDGLEIVADYNATISRVNYNRGISNFYYPVYIVNQTPCSKLLIGKDSHLFAIQEAQDENGSWFPIEIRKFDFCGNGYWGLAIHSREFATVLFPKYDGDFKTSIRVRIQNDELIYVSTSFEGSINEDQFLLSDEQRNFWQELFNDKYRASEQLFYGTMPKELDTY